MKENIWSKGGCIPKSFRKILNNIVDKIIKHKEYKVYIPELIFGQLLTSSTFAQEKRITAGTHGLGAKLTNIFSKDVQIKPYNNWGEQKNGAKFEFSEGYKRLIWKSKVKFLSFLINIYLMWAHEQQDGN